MSVESGGSLMTGNFRISRLTYSGGGHCGAASNYPTVPATYHTIGRLIEWVEKGEAEGHTQYRSARWEQKDKKTLSVAVNRRVCRW